MAEHALGMRDEAGSTPVASSKEMTITMRGSPGNDSDVFAFTKSRQGCPP